MKKIKRDPTLNRDRCPRCGSYRVFIAGCCGRTKRKCQRCDFLGAPKYFRGTPLPSKKV